MKKLLFFLLLMLIPIRLLAADETVGPYNFGGGLNLKTIATDIDDSETPDSVNFINDLNGAAFKRHGSDRFISQAISSNPICTLYRAYVSSNSTSRKLLIATTRDSIYYSTNDTSPSWIRISSGLYGNNQHFSTLMMNNKILMTGDKLTDDMSGFDYNNSSFTDLIQQDFVSTNSVNLHCKYFLNAKNYLVGANCAQMPFGQSLGSGTTYYKSRIFYTTLLTPSSFTASRFIDIRADDGDEITGISYANKVIDVFKQNSIWELSFNTLALTIDKPPGDQVLTNIVQGFGCIAPRTIQTTGDFFVFLAKDGIRYWDGGEKSRLDQAQESRTISDKIQPLIDEIIRAGTYVNAVGKFYAKAGGDGWYIFAYEDPKISPHGKNNSVIVYDFRTENWYRFLNWNVECMETEEFGGDSGQLLYGDSTDGYIYLADYIDAPGGDDARKEFVLDPMESTSTWTVEQSSQDIFNVKEGTASIRLPLTSFTVKITSITKIGEINIGDFLDKTRVTKSDKLSFKVYVSSIQNLSNVRVDLELNDAAIKDFDTNFTSITIATASLTGGNTSWSTIEVPLSSFTIISNWTDINTGTIPFANTLTFYGIRFVANAISTCQVNIDDVRIVEGTQAPLNAYRYSKIFHSQDMSDVDWRQVMLMREAAADSNISIDVISNLGQNSLKEDLNGDFDHSIYVGDYNNGNNITRLSSLDYSFIESTDAVAQSVFACRHEAVDDKYVYCGDQYNNRIFKLDKSTISQGVFVSSFGTLGTGNNQFNGIWQIGVDDKYLYIADYFNQRIKVHDKFNFNYVNSFGSLGTGNTNFHMPSGVAVDEKSMWVGDDANYAIKQFDKLTGVFKNSVPLNFNTVGDLNLAVDDQNLYDSYNTISDNGQTFMDVVLEKRNKSNLSLINRVVLRPKNSPVLISSYSVMGDVSLSNNYVYVSFTDDITGNGNYYIQKLLKSDFSIISELKTANKMFNATVNTLSYRPKLKTINNNLLGKSPYMQLKYYESGALDNNFKLYNQSFIIDRQPVQEKMK